VQTSLFRGLSEYAKGKHAAIKKLALGTQAAVYKDVIPGYRIRPISEREAHEKVSQEVRRQRNFEQALVSGYRAYLDELARLAEVRSKRRRKGRAPPSSNKTGKTETADNYNNVNGNNENHDDDQKSLADVAISCACMLLLAVPHFNFRGELLKIVVDVVIIGGAASDNADGGSSSSSSSSSKDAAFSGCIHALEELFASDDDGQPSLDAVALLAKRIKARAFRVDERVLNTFLHLRLLTDFAAKGSHSKVDLGNSSSSSSSSNPTPDTATAAAAAGGRAAIRARRRQEKRVGNAAAFQSKKQRRLDKERRAVAHELRAADAAAGREERDRLQGETLKLVFLTYFRILKARAPALTGAALEGLARYAHLINQDFFGDLLEALKDLIREKARVIDGAGGDDDDDDGGGGGGGGGDGGGASTATTSGTGTGAGIGMRSPVRQVLLCIITAFALLQGQETRAAAQSLGLDLDFFVAQLYRVLHPLALDADIERSARSLHLPDPHQRHHDDDKDDKDDNDHNNISNNNSSSSSSSINGTARAAKPAKVNLATNIVLLLRCLAAVVLPAHGARAAAAAAVPPLRVAAFTKQAMTAALHVPEKSGLALLAFVARVLRVHGGGGGSRSGDSGGGGGGGGGNGGNGSKIAGLWRADEKTGDGVFDGAARDIAAANPFAATVWEGELLRRHYSPKVREAARRLELSV
jgi:nucleolar complex protein 3